MWKSSSHRSHTQNQQAKDHASFIRQYTSSSQWHGNHEAAGSQLADPCGGQLSSSAHSEKEPNP